MGSSMNPLYYDFWPIISKTWREIFNITPILGLISDEDSDFIEDEYGLIKKFKSIEGIDIGLQSQIIRLYLPSILDSTSLISDIDMVPLSKKYFIDYISSFDENKFYVMTSDHPECLAFNQYQMCYNVSKPDLFKDILEVEDSWIDFAKKLNNLGQGWTTDQNYLYRMVNKYHSMENIVLLNRGFNNFNNFANNRIDRGYWSYSDILVKNEYYFDSHLLRPYKENKEEIDNLIKLLY